MGDLACTSFQPIPLPTTTAQPIRAAYVHIPFCRRRCFYCDFPITAIGDRPLPGTIAGMARYVDVLIRELEATAGAIAAGIAGTANGRGNNEGLVPLSTVFFGGGTPSLLPPDQLERIVVALEGTFGFAPDVEISIEMDPGTFDRARARDYRALGINRVSLGAQAFQDELLAVCGRSHRTADIFTAVEHLQQAGIENASLDLISGLPHQTLAQWQDSLQQAIAIAPEHLSCYDLIVEAGTPFSKQYQPGELPLPDDDLAAAMYRTAREYLCAAGFEHYEVSNYGRAGHQCRHNRTYWEFQPFYGFGMGAASYWGDRRLSRPRTRQTYYDWVDAFARSPATALHAVDPLSPLDRLLECLMLGLRLVEGIDLATLQREHPLDFLPALAGAVRPYRERGWLEAIAPDGTLASGEELPVPGRLRLSDPEGFLFSNTVLADLFAALED